MGDEQEQAQCLLQWARSPDGGIVAQRRLRELLHNSASAVGGTFALALARLSQEAGNYTATIEYAHEAIPRCFYSSNYTCELQGRRLLAFSFSETGRLIEAIWEGEKMVVAAELFGAQEDRFKSALALATARAKSWRNLGRVVALLEQINPVVQDREPLEQLLVYNLQAGMKNLLGYWDEAAVAYQRVQDLATELNRGDLASTAEFNRLLSLSKKARYLNPDMPAWSLAKQFQAQVDDPATSLAIKLRSLAQLASVDPDQSVVHLSTCVNMPQANKHPRHLARCAARLAQALVAQDPQRAEALIQTAKEAAARAGSVEAETEYHRARISYLWQTQPADQALALSLEHLDAEVRKRQLQSSDTRQAEFLASLNADHYWLAARIANEVSSGRLPAQALSRSIILLERVRGVGSSESSAGDKDQLHLHQWARRIAQLREQPGRDWRSELEAIEAMPADYLKPAPIPLTPAQQPVVESTQSRLRNDQAVIMFQWQPITGLRGGGSWRYVITQDEIRAYPLSGRGRLEFVLASLRAGFGEDGQSESMNRALDSAYQILFADALTAIPSGVKELILIPDGPLYSLPVLPMARYDKRLAEAQIYPSLRAWQRALQPANASAEIVVFANPTAPSKAYQQVGLREPLPHAIEEAKSVAALFGSDVAVVSGTEATESQARIALQSQARIVHFASHAVVDSANPQSSALVLAADDRHDGWLSLAEVSALQLPPKVVVLSACESASGRMLSGAGLVGLASGLLDAGAQTVVANLWPIDDTHAATLIGRFYGYLQSGSSMTEALRLAEEDLAAAGYPLAAWAGWTIIGDGSVRLSRSSYLVWWLILGAALLLLAALWRALPGRH